MFALVPTLLIALAAGPEPLTPEQVFQTGPAKAVTVAFPVRNVRAETRSTTALDPTAERDERKNSLSVVLTQEALGQLKKIGVPDAAAHFTGKRVRVTGEVTATVYTGLNMTGTVYRLVVSDISQFEAVE